MTDPRLPWRGTGLLPHLADRLVPGRFVDLSVHTSWLLLQVRPRVIADDPSAARTLWLRAERLLDSTDISRQSRDELAQIRYALRVEGITA